MLDDLLLFAEVARRGSFSQTAKALRLTSSTLSKRITLLETRLGSPLFVRSARGVNLTSYGQDIFNRYAADVLEISQALSAKDVSLPSRFNLQCPQNLMQGPLFKALSRFASLPELNKTDLTIEPANNNVQLSQTSFDMAIRVGKQKNSAYYQKAIGEIAVALVCVTGCASREVLVTPYDNFPEYHAALKNVPHTFTRSIQTNDITVARLLVQDKVGVGLLPMTEVQQLINAPCTQCEYMSGILFTRPVYALWPNTQTPPAITSLLLDILCDSKIPALSGKQLTI